MMFQRGDLEQMKRSELQKLCKLHGVKANMKTVQLIDGLMAQCSVEAEETKLNEVSEKQASPAIAGCVVVDSKSVVNNEPGQGTEHKQENAEEQIAKNSQEQITKENKTSVKASTMIPRWKAGPEKTTKNTPKQVQKTPKIGSAPKDWSKIHQKQFEKMESLGEYLEKKRKRAADLTSSAKKVKLSTKDVDNAKKKPLEQAILSNTKLQKTNEATKTALVEKKKRLTFNFASKSSTKENMAATPGAIKRRATLGSTKTPTQQKPTTPFRFTGSTNMNTSLFSPTPRKAFDLKASLAKPLSYKPYTGKLPSPTQKKPCNGRGEVTKKITHERQVKNVTVTTRKDRRTYKITKQSKARSQASCKRRGVAF